MIRYQVNHCTQMGLQLLLLLMMIFVAWFSLTPVQNPEPLPVSDKLIHGLTYLTLAIVADHAYATSLFTPKKMLWLFGFGLSLEVLQLYVPGRDYSYLDMLANGAGILAWWLAGKTLFLRTPTPIPDRKS